MKRKPTIHELEAILAEDNLEIEILPDGSVVAVSLGNEKLIEAVCHLLSLNAVQTLEEASREDPNDTDHAREVTKAFRDVREALRNIFAKAQSPQEGD